MFVFRKIGAAQRTSDSFPLFDWLRLALASTVALYHEELIPWRHAGNFAVQIFFALSGWLIGGILLSTDRAGLPKFYYNRASRIWIPYFIAVAVLYGLAAAREGVTPTFLRILLFDSTFTHNWFVDPAKPMPLHGTGAHFWSIAVEEQFYLAAPLLLVVFKRGRSVAFWTIIAAVAVLSGSLYGAISLGVLAAVVRSHYGDWQLTKAGTTATAAATISALTALALLPGSYLTIAPIAAVTIVLLLSRQGPRTMTGEFAGGVSYPLYLYHWIGMFAVNFLARHVGIAMPSIASYLFAVAAGIAAYVAVDRNVMRWRSSYYHPALGKALMVSAYSLLGLGLVRGIILG